MITLRTKSHLGKPVQQPLQARFPAPGGTIGRAPDCTLVLADPGKMVSRLHARIACSSSGVAITCVSAGNPVLVNQQELLTGQSRPLEHGDTIAIAGYELAVQFDAARPAAASAEIPDDIFGDLLGGGRSKAAVAPAAGGWAGGGWPADPSSGAPGTPPAPGSSAPPLAVSPPGPDVLSFTPPASAASFDPFAALDEAPAQAVRPDALPPAAAAPAPAEPSPLRGLGIEPDIRPAESLDSLFDLKSAKDPLGLGSPMSAPAAGPNTTGDLDPLAALTRAAPPAPQPSMPERGHALSDHFELPGRRPAAAAGPGSPVESLVRDGAVLSWQRGALPPAVSDAGAPALPAEAVRAIGEQMADQHRSLFEASPATRPTTLLNEINDAQMRAMQAAAGGSPAAGGGATGAGADEPAARPPAAARATDAEFELLSQFLLGVGLTELPRGPGAQGRPPALTPELMRRLGELVRVSTEGTVELLKARAVLKHEMRTEVTLITTRDNNPLKFSPDGAAAVAHLLSARPVRGFLEPVPAMRDAYNDLLAHQIAFVAGMRGAMQGLIARFDAARLEERLSRRSMLDSMLPMARKARLWELFTELFAEISAEAEDDFEALFGRAFVAAYEEQLARLEQPAGGRSEPS